MAYNAGFVLEALGHLTGKKTPPLVTRYSAWLMGRVVFFASEKIRQELGYQPSVGYDEGIARSVRWALEHTEAGKA